MIVLACAFGGGLLLGALWCYCMSAVCKTRQTDFKRLRLSAPTQRSHFIRDHYPPIQRPGYSLDSPTASDLSSRTPSPLPWCHKQHDSMFAVWRSSASWCKNRFRFKIRQMLLNFLCFFFRQTGIGDFLPINTLPCHAMASDRVDLIVFPSYVEKLRYVFLDCFGKDRCVLHLYQVVK